MPLSAQNVVLQVQLFFGFFNAECAVDAERGVGGFASKGTRFLVAREKFSLRVHRVLRVISNYSEITAKSCSMA